MNIPKYDYVCVLCGKVIGYCDKDLQDKDSFVCMKCIKTELECEAKNNELQAL
jgi:hypothetical protein